MFQAMDGIEVNQLTNMRIKRKVFREGSSMISRKSYILAIFLFSLLVVTGLTYTSRICA